MSTRNGSRFEILPAIDLVDGRVVRLRRGDFATADVFSDDPLAVGAAFAAAGAGWLHIVDLDGARAREPVQAPAIGRLLAAVGSAVACEVAGGLRTERAVDDVLAAGAMRAVLGTVALEDPAMVGRLVSRLGPERLVAAIDVRAGLAVGDAWQAAARGTSVDLAIRRLVDAGIRLFEVTAIGRDGLMAGPDLELLATVAAMKVDLIASGGIRSVADLEAVRALGCAGAIVGRALYDGSLDLREALAATA